MSWWNSDAYEQAQGKRGVSFPTKTLNSDAYDAAIAGKQNLNRYGDPMPEPSLGGGNRLMQGLASTYVDELYSDAGPLVPFGRGALQERNVLSSADDYVDGAPYDKWATDFTDEDIVDAVALTKGGAKTKTPKKQIKKRAKVRQAVRQAKAQPEATNPYSKNPFASNFSPSAFVDGAGSRRADEQYIPGAKAYEAARDVRINDRSAPGNKGAYGYDDKIMSLF